MKNLFKRTFVVLLIAVVTFSITSCGANEEENGGSDKVPELTMAVLGNVPSNSELFYEKLDEMTKRDLGITVRLVTLPSADVMNQYNLALTTGEYDMYLSGNWMNHAANARANAFLEITDMVKTVTPALYAAIPKDDWDGSMIDGKLYCIPQTTRDYSTISGFIYRDDLRTKYNVAEIKSLDDVADFLRAVLPNEPGMSGLIASPARKYTYAKNHDYVGIDAQDVGGGLAVYGLVTTQSNDLTSVVSLLDDPVYLEVITKMKQWYDEGLVNKDILSGQLNATDMMRAGTAAGSIGTDARDLWYWGQTFEETHPDWNIEMYMFGAVNYKSRSGQTSVVIGAKSKYPELCLKFFEKVRTNRDYYDLMFYGVKGANYNLTEAGEIDTQDIAQENLYTYWTFWGDENLTRKQANRWSRFDEVYDGFVLATARVDPLNGFQLDTSAISAELAAMQQVQTQYQAPLEAGISADPVEDLEKLKIRYKDAGIDKIINALEGQLKAFAEYRASLK
ncbi:MAG: extracellular solute-binding protein [Clostridiales bacterium]|nr:extracellular solute-binding protein [Clostridiales bacterium]